MLGIIHCIVLLHSVTLNQHPLSLQYDVLGILRERDEQILFNLHVEFGTLFSHK